MNPILLFLFLLFLQEKTNVIVILIANKQISNLNRFLLLETQNNKINRLWV